MTVVPGRGCGKSHAARLEDLEATNLTQNR